MLTLEGMAWTRDGGQRLPCIVFQSLAYGGTQRECNETPGSLTQQVKQG